MATFRVDFLGCKVSHANAHEVREALLRDGDDERRERGAQVVRVRGAAVTEEGVRAEAA